MRETSLTRRRLAYPILTLCVAAAVYFYSQGSLSGTRPALDSEFDAFAREVMVEVRAGRPIPKAVDPVVETVFRAIAPESVRSEGGGALSFELDGVPDGSSAAHTRRVVVRALDGEGVGLLIAIEASEPKVVGVERVERRRESATP